MLKLNINIKLLIITISVVSLSFTSEAKTPATNAPIPTAVNGMVSTQESIASQVGLQILKQGGNAIDAAVAVGFALAVTYPRAGNLGGGGFMVIYQAEGNKSTAIDYREVAPKSANRDMFLDQQGNVDNEMARFSALSSGVPGTVAGLIFALKHYGTMPLEIVIQPAIELAVNGFEVSPEFHRALTKYQNRLKSYPSTKSVYYPNEGQAVEIGGVFKQPDIGSVLTEIKAKGDLGFYQGKVAEKIAADSRTNGGIISLDDLASYQVVERPVISGTYRGYKIISMPPPSSGGVHIIQMLNILEHWDIRNSKANTAKTINLMVEAMKRAYADRSEHLGDPAFYRVPLKKLTSKAYAAQIVEQINNRAVTPSNEISPFTPVPKESNQTTHFSVMDKYGNAVANTYTLNASFGNGRVAAGTGILMNNQMDDFSAKPGAPNMFGLLGGEANAIEAGKRPLSSMTPTIVVNDDRAILATGSVGGSRIITTVLQLIVNVIDHDMDIDTATQTPRVHHQWYPDSLLMEAGFDSDVLNQLRKLGYRVDAPELMGHSDTPAGEDIGYVQSVMFKNGIFTGSADPRRKESLAIGY